MATTQSVVIVGAGIGGLSAGALLSKQGYEVKLFEKENRVGGRVFSYQHEGCTLDSGINVAGNGPAGDLGKVLKASGADKYVQLGSGDEPVLLLWDKDYVFPRNPMEVNKWQVMPVDARMDFADLAIQSVTKSPDELKRLDDRPMEEYLSDRYQDERYHTVLESLARMSAVVPDLKVMSTYAFLRLLRSTLETSKYSSYPKQGGVGAFPNAFEKVIRENKGEIKLKTEVKTILVERGKVRGVQLADGSTVESGTVALNLPPKTIVKVLGKSASKEIVDKARNLRPAIGAFVSFCIDKPIRKGSTTLYTVPGTALYEIHEPTNTSPGLAPQGKYIAAVLHAVWNESDLGKAKDAILSDFPKKFPDVKIFWSKAATYSNENPIYGAGSFVGNRKHRFDVKCKEIDGLYFVGDFVGEPGPGMNPAAASAAALTKMLSSKS
nr:FAD-dependent oxidoreductase [Candidatus Njordarchaeum guaymaensis]